ncbi:GpE family phage tail protein [Pantoea septica]
MTVEDLVADIATVFHWPPPVMYVESLTDVLEWRHKAMQRSGAGDDE